MTLREAIVQVLGNRSLTYREITDSVNAQRIYVPRDGMLVPEAQVRATVGECLKYFKVDRSRPPHKVSVHLQIPRPEEARHHDILRDRRPSEERGVAQTG